MKVKIIVQMRILVAVLLVIISLNGCSSDMFSEPSPPLNTTEILRMSDPTNEPTSTVTETNTALLTDRPTVTSRTSPETTPSPRSYGLEKEVGRDRIIDKVITDLAIRLDLAEGEVSVASVEEVKWGDASLGCPQEGEMYAQTITPGYRIELRSQGQRYQYHTDQGTYFVLCRGGEPELPVFPIKPGGIDDGEPWMPVGTPQN